MRITILLIEIWMGLCYHVNDKSEEIRNIIAKSFLSVKFDRFSSGDSLWKNTDALARMGIPCRQCDLES